MEHFAMLPLFLLLVFAASAKSLENPWAPDAFKVGCPTENIMCNVHLSHHFHCFCHVNRPVSKNMTDFQWYEDYNTCTDLFDVGPNPKQGVYEARINLELYPKKINSWVDFDYEFSQYISRVTNTNQNQILIIRKYCYRKSLDVQFVFLSQKTLDNWHGERLTIKNVTKNVYFDNELVKKIPVLKSISQASHVPDQASLKYYAKDFCESGIQLSLPTVCNTHDPKLACICGFNSTGNGTGPFYDLPFCDTLHFEKQTDNIFTLVFIRNLDIGMAENERLLLNDLCDMMDLPRGSYVILRKFCQNGLLHVQVARLAVGNLGKLPPYNTDDFIDAGLSSALVEHIIPYTHAGNLHEKSMSKLILLRQIDFDDSSNFDDRSEFMKRLFKFFFDKNILLASVLGMIGLAQYVMWQNAVAIEKSTEKYEKFLNREFGDILNNLEDVESDVEDDGKGAAVRFIDENDDADHVSVVSK